MLPYNECDIVLMFVNVNRNPLTQFIPVAVSNAVQIYGLHHKYTQTNTHTWKTYAKLSANTIENRLKVRFEFELNTEIDRFWNVTKIESERMASEKFMVQVQTISIC